MQINTRAVVTCVSGGPLFIGAESEIFGCSGCDRPLIRGVSPAAFAATFPNERGGVVHCVCGAYSVLPE